MNGEIVAMISKRTATTKPYPERVTSLHGLLYIYILCNSCETLGSLDRLARHRRGGDMRKG